MRTNVMPTNVKSEIVTLSSGANGGERFILSVQPVRDRDGISTGALICPLFLRLLNLFLEILNPCCDLFLAEMSEMNSD